MTPVSPDSVYVSRPMEPDASRWAVLHPSEYQTPSRGVSSAPWRRTRRASEQTCHRAVTRADKERQTSITVSPSVSHGATWRPHEPGSGCNVKKATARRRKAQSTQSLERSRSHLNSNSTPKVTRVQLRWNDLDDAVTTVTEAQGSSTDDEQRARSFRASSRRYLWSRIMRSSPRARLPPRLSAHES